MGSGYCHLQYIKAGLGVYAAPFAGILAQAHINVKEMAALLFGLRALLWRLGGPGPAGFE